MQRICADVAGKDNLNIVQNHLRHLLQSKSNNHWKKHSLIPKVGTSYVSSYYLFQVWTWINRVDSTVYIGMMMWIGVVLVLYMKFDLILWYLLHQCVNNELQLSWFLTFENYSMYLIIFVCLMNWICQREQDRCKLLHNKAYDMLNTCFASWILGNALFTLIEHNTLSSGK